MKRVLSGVGFALSTVSAAAGSALPVALASVGFALLTASTAGAAPASPLRVSGRHLVDHTGHCVRLMGTMRSINPYFDGGRWGDGHDGGAAKRALAHYDKVFAALADRKQGSWCNMVRLTDDGHWSNDDRLKPDKDSPHFYACDWKRYGFFVENVLVPIVENAVRKHGLYVIIRPSYNNPGDTKVGDDFNLHLKKEWRMLASNPKLQAMSGQVLFELQNEPTRIFGEDGKDDDTALTRFMQPLIGTVRQAGFKGVILAPGLGYQSWYDNYIKHPLRDRNLGYAVHVYPGWYGQNDDNADVGMLAMFGNVSTIAGDSYIYNDIDEYLKTGKVKPCFWGEPECCSHAFFKLFRHWAKAKRETPRERDARCARMRNPPGKFRNPVIYADCPDMSLCSDGEYYYMVSTTMHLMPGAPIMRSKDLTGWETIGYAFDRFEENPGYSLEDGKTGYAAGQWASSPRVPLRFDTGKFFMGSRFAIFNYATKSPGGSVAVDYFRMRAAERE